MCIMLSTIGAYLVFALIGLASTKRIIVVSVGGNTTDDASKVFQPQSVKADQGDVVYFNFTLGNHTVTQSLFASPCIAGHTSNYNFNSFDSGFRNAGDGSGFSDMLITILDPNTPMWFFDYNTCAKGGIGAINPPDSGNQTLQKFQDNALNINGTGVHTQSTSTSSQTGSVSPPAQTRASSDASQVIAVGMSAALPLAILALSL